MPRTHWHAVEISGYGDSPEGPAEWEPSEDIYRTYDEAFEVAQHNNNFLWSCTDPSCRDRFGPEWWRIWPDDPIWWGLALVGALLLWRWWGHH